jgi:hypothetical protein
LTTASTTIPARAIRRGAITAALGLLALAPLVHPAHAGVAYDASLAAPGVYFGTGNANVGFTVSTANSVELGLSAITRYTGPITPVGDVYHAALGNAVPPTTGTAWGVDFSINLRAGGGSLTLGNVDAVLTVTDEGTGFNTTITDFLGFLPDNTCYNGSVTSCSNSSDYGVQNSEPASLFAAIGDTNFNNFVADTYIVTLSVYGCATGGCETNLLATDTIEVQTPEPNTIAIFGMALAGLGLLHQYRRGSRNLS